MKKRLVTAGCQFHMVIEKTNSKSASDIALEIENAKNQELSDYDIVLGKKSTLSEKLYYHLPGFSEELFGKLCLELPGLSSKKWVALRLHQ